MSILYNNRSRVANMVVEFIVFFEFIVLLAASSQSARGLFISRLLNPES